KRSGRSRSVSVLQEPLVCCSIVGPEGGWLLTLVAWNSDYGALVVATSRARSYSERGRTTRCSFWRGLQRIQGARPALVPFSPFRFLGSQSNGDSNQGLQNDRG